MAVYGRLMDAELRLDEVRRRRGIAETALGDALEAIESKSTANEQDEDLYLSTLARYVVALGGHLELVAVFPDTTVTLLREPGGPAEPTGPAGPAEPAGAAEPAGPARAPEPAEPGERIA